MNFKGCAKHWPSFAAVSSALSFDLIDYIAEQESYKGVEVERLTEYHIWDMSYEVVRHVFYKVVRRVSNLSADFVTHVRHMLYDFVTHMSTMTLCQTFHFHPFVIGIHYDTVSDFPLPPLCNRNTLHNILSTLVFPRFADLVATSAIEWSIFGIDSAFFRIDSFRFLF